MKKLILLFSILLVYVGSFADTTFVSGTIINQTWTLKNSPYCIQGEIEVAKLTIEEGVKIIFLGTYTFNVNGIINANGNKNKPIIFTKTESISGWSGISFQNTPPGSNLNYCIIEYSNNSGVRISNSSPHLENCIIRNNSSKNNGGGIKITNTSTDTIYVKNCTINSNSVSTSYSVPASNGAGIYVTSSNAPVIFFDCTISDNYAYRTNGVVDGGGVWTSGNVYFIESFRTVHHYDKISQ